MHKINDILVFLAPQLSLKNVYKIFKQVSPLKKEKNLLSKGIILKLFLFSKVHFLFQIVLFQIVPINGYFI